MLFFSFTITGLNCLLLTYILTIAGGVALTMGKLGPNDTDYLIDNVQCDGSENSLVMCGHNGVGVHNCRAGEHASVICGTSQGMSK